MPIKFRWPQDINAIRFGSVLVWRGIAGIINTVTGTSPLSLVNALAKPIKSLIQYGKCALNGADIVCNNGTLGFVDDDIPEEYVRLEYLESTGTQYIDSGVKINYAQAKNEQIATVQYTKSNSNRELMGANGYGFFGKSASNKLESASGSSSPVTESALSKSIVSLMTDPSTNSVTFNVNGKQYTVTASTLADNSYSIYIFALGGRDEAAASFFCNARVYDYIIKIDDVILAHLLPVKRRSDGVLGMYDIVTNTFKTNAGTGTFTAGPAVGHIGVIGTPEILTVSGENLVDSSTIQSAIVPDLYAVGDCKDEIDIISGTVTRRCEAVISDGTTPSGRYIGTVGEGNIIVKVRETGYEGDIVTFDADRVAPLNGLSVNVEPIQDLHGYDSPWPAGGGKNKFDSSLFDTPTVGNALVYTHYDVPNGTYTMSTPDFPLVSDIANVFFLTGAVTSGAKSLTNGVTTENSRTITVTDGHYTVVYRSSQSSNTNNPKDFKWQIESGSAPTAWTPFSNICPISGWTAANVTRTGKNLIPSIDDTAFWDTSGFFNKNGTITVRTNYKTSTYLPVIGGCQYVFSTFNENETIISGWKGLLVYDSNKQPLQDTFYENNATNIAITIPDEGSYIKIYTVLANNITYQQLELGATSTTYEPYTSNTYTIQLGETVYGGTLDVTGGKMVVDRAMVDLGTLSWAYSGESSNHRFSAAMPSDYKQPTSAADRADMICSAYASNPNVVAVNNALGVSGYQGTNQVFIRDLAYTDSATFKAAVSGVQLVYELATPFEITLTPTQIDTLLGTNNIWSDAGDVSVLVLEPTTESVTPQPLNTTKGTNIISATSNVDPIEFKIEYYKDE